MECPHCQKQVTTTKIHGSKSYKVACPFCKGTFKLKVSKRFDENFVLVFAHWVLAILWMSLTLWAVVDAFVTGRLGIEAGLLSLPFLIAIFIPYAWYIHDHKVARMYLYIHHIIVIVVGIPSILLTVGVSLMLVAQGPNGGFFPGLAFATGIGALIGAVVASGVVFLSWKCIKYFRSI